ncbi:retrotransposon protein, putative, ty1-copia subclass, partial [Tanacetum coccineum]
MKSYIDNFECLGHPVSLNLGVSLILISLPKEFDSFVQNYNMHSMRKMVTEFHTMLKLHEQTLTKKDPALHAIRAGKGLKGSRKLKPRALSLYVGNGQRAAVEAIGTYHLCLPSRLVIVLNNCHYVPSITRGIILVSRLYDDGYVNRFVDNAISNNKISKSNFDSALMWHCHLGHISKKRIEKLQHDGVINSTDLRTFEKCVPCVSGKLARKPYTHQVERAKDLLGLIYTDHKNEVFETFKVFQKEVENQLGKTIKLLCSDRGGEYMSQEFLDHLKDHGIIAHRTPPYTPFGVNSLETAARILNMVPTKKVEKTPYKVWHGQAPKLSYLKVWGCEALIKRDTLTKPDKLKPGSIKCIFVGNLKETIGYSFYYPPENKVLVARNAEFLENSLITQEASGS